MSNRVQTRRALAALLVLLMIVVSGCGANPANPTPIATATPASPTPVATATPAAAALDPFEPYKDTLVMTYAKGINPTEKYGEGESPENNQYTRNAKDVLNIDAQTYWQAAEGPDYDQKVNLSIASNDLPDAMVVNATQLRQMVKADQLADLKAVYDTYTVPAVKYMMDTSNGAAQSAVTFNGKMMAIPSLNVPENDYSLMWIRKDWLDKLGLAVPKTLDELETVAKAFIEKDPDGNGKNDTIGIAGPGNGGLLTAHFLDASNINFGLDPLFSALHSYPGFWLKGTDGKIIYGSILPETKTVLARIVNLYSKGILDKQIAIRKDTSELVVSGTTGIYFGAWWSGYWPLPDAIKNNPKANWQAYSLYDDQGKANFHRGTPCNDFVVVRKGYAHPEAAIKIIGLNNRDAGKANLNISGAGNEVLRLPLAAFDEGEFEGKAISGFLAGTKTLADYTDQEYAIYKLMKADLSAVKTVKLEPFDQLDIQFWNTSDPNFPRLYSLMVGNHPIYDKVADQNLVYSALYSQTKSMETKWANLKKMEDETFLRIITGASPIDSFDQFVLDWKAQGGDQITAEVETEAAMQ